jgi:hypothetical protein
MSPEMDCPQCGADMEQQQLEGHHGRPVVVDVCRPCGSIWFDTNESPALTPGATLSLFRLIGETARVRGTPPAASPRRADLAKCPQCRARLRRTHDRQRATRFQYLRCPHGHGRLTTFYDFLLEKDFVRPLTAEQIADLRRNVQTVNCSNCGAPIDLARGGSCAHCGSPLSMLDMAQAETLIAQLRAADDRSRQPIDPALPLAMARARREVEQSFANLRQDEVWFREATHAGLVAAGLNVMVRWLKGPKRS